jgi:ferredoxin
MGNTGYLSNILISMIVVGLVLGGPLTLYAIIKILNTLLGSPRASFVKLKDEKAPLGLLVTWDDSSFEWQICRVRLEFIESVKGGRSTSFSFTFDDKTAKKRSFLIPMQLSKEDFAMITDKGLGGARRVIANSFFNIEIETTNGMTERQKIGKSKVLAALAGPPFLAPKDIDALPPTPSDAWSVLTRVFPWRKVAASTEATPDKAAGAHGPAKPKEASKGPAAPVDFLVTKVWIEPGCIVCDACENEAPQVFHVLADTCIVRENADLSDGASIKAAAEGCPVDVIKFTTSPKA